MDAELAALAASGASTLVSLMVTDSWTQARDLLGRFFSRTTPTAIADLDDTRTRLLVAEERADARTAPEITAQWHVLHHLLQTGSVTSDDLRELLASLEQLVNSSAPDSSAVHNNISGGVQHGPVIQSGRIAGLVLHPQDRSAPGQS
ncbi:hypothetical protein [Streptomyces sp. NPDC048565]|uniref:hypothetical protein n=1 Tax=Streptomyces sp. NPDC048565 TaxID=3155266 RepID=UPI0034157FA6